MFMITVIIITIERKIFNKYQVINGFGSIFVAQYFSASERIICISTHMTACIIFEDIVFLCENPGKYNPPHDT